MQECIENYMRKYGKEYGSRFTRRQKTAFIETAVADFEEMGLRARSYETKQGVKRIRNILIGNLDAARTIILVPYDTPSKALYPGYKYYPFDRTKTVKQEKINSFIQVILCLLLCTGAKHLLDIREGLGASASYLLTFLVLAVLGLAIKIYIGFPAKLCYNRNSAAIALVMDFASKADMKKTAIVLMDSSVSSFEGYKQVSDYYGSRIHSKKFLILNCLGEMDSLSIGCKYGSAEFVKEFMKGAEEGLEIDVKVLAQDVADKLPLFYFPNCAMLTGGRTESGEQVVRGTRSGRDAKADCELIGKVSHMLEEALK